MKVEYSQALLDLAEDWETHRGILVDPNGREWPVTRCSTCDEALLHEAGTTAGKAYNLLVRHGYKMDGRHENDLVLEALKAAARGEMNQVVS